MPPSDGRKLRPSPAPTPPRVVLLPLVLVLPVLVLVLVVLLVLLQLMLLPPALLILICLSTCPAALEVSPPMRTVACSRAMQGAEEGENLIGAPASVAVRTCLLPTLLARMVMLPSNSATASTDNCVHRAYKSDRIERAGLVHNYLINACWVQLRVERMKKALELALLS